MHYSHFVEKYSTKWQPTVSTTPDILAAQKQTGA
jgi:hypothetical protein